MAELLHRRVVYDVVIVGGGPAGLSAALILGRCRRRVLLCDAGQPRNARVARAARYLTRDGTPPLELLRLGREELRRTASSCATSDVTGVTCADDGFDVTLDGATASRARAHRNRRSRSAARHSRPRGVLRHQRASLSRTATAGKSATRRSRSSARRRGSRPRALAQDLERPGDRSARTARAAATAHGEQLAAHGIAVHEGRIARLEHDGGRVQRRRARRRRRRVPCEAIFFTHRPAPSVRSAAAARMRDHAEAWSRPITSARRACPGCMSWATPRATSSSSIVAAAEGAKAARRDQQGAAGARRPRRHSRTPTMTDTAHDRRHRAAPPDNATTPALDRRSAAASR